MSDGTIEIGSDFFLEIAKLRAIRLLWAQTGESPKRILARTSLSNKTDDPYMNLVRATTEALSAIIGGCDDLEVRPAGFPEHLAANVQRILKEEAHVDRLADPAAGSYYIEALTHSLARGDVPDLEHLLSLIHI